LDAVRRYTQRDGLENSHKLQRVRETYCQRDVDKYCTNRPGVELIESGEKKWMWDGAISKDPIKLQSHFGGRWLTSDYQVGDVVVFGMFTIHCSLDNQSNRIRLSTDSRYQLASEPVDERWIGENPIGHGLEGKIGMIC